MLGIMKSKVRYENSITDQEESGKKEYCWGRDRKRTIDLSQVQCGCLLVSWSIEDGVMSLIVRGDRMGHRRNCILVIVQARRKRKHEQKDQRRKCHNLYTRALYNELILKQQFGHSCTQRVIYVLKLFQMGPKSLMLL